MVIFNEAKPKYEKLDELLDNHLKDIRFSSQVNLIIDVKELSKKFFRPDIIIDNLNRRSLIEEISSDIINIISHYRNYFFKRGKYVSFYFLYSYNRCETMINSCKGFPYKEEYYKKYLEGDDPKVELIKKAIRIVEKVVNIVPHSKFIDTSDYDEFLYSKFFQSQPENQLNLILSNDDIFYQLVNKNIFILCPKGIKSELVTPDNCMRSLIGHEPRITYRSLPTVLAFSGIKRYSFKSLPGVALLKGVKIAEKLLDKGILKDESSLVIPIDFSKLDKTTAIEKKILDNRDQITENYDIIRGDKIYYAHSTDIARKYAMNTEIGTVNRFLDLNARIFTQYPLQLDMMLKGEQI